MTRLLLLTAMMGHLLCWVCDLLLTYSPSGKFNFHVLNDNEKLSAVFEKMPLKKLLVSMLLGALALMMCFGGYFGLSEWIRQFLGVYSIILLGSAIVCFISGTAHHVFCGAVEWFYIRFGRTENARQIIAEFFKKTSVTMYGILDLRFSL